jgi:hypothetical protein
MSARFYDANMSTREIARRGSLTCLIASSSTARSPSSSGSAILGGDYGLDSTSCLASALVDVAHDSPALPRV